jgi:uncharacterized protein DUF2147
MKRLYGLAALLLLTTSADAGQISFSVGGHRIHIEAPRHCRSTSCASVSVSGIYKSRRRDRDDDERDVAPPPPPPAAAPAPTQVSPPPALPAQPNTIVTAAPPPPPTSPPAVGFSTASVSTQTVATRPLPPVPPPPAQPAVTTQPCVAPLPVPQPVETTPSPPPASAKPQVVKTLHEEDADTPIGDWQTQNKGVVRIAQCGAALCGYTLDPSSNDKGEAILINMKPKTDTRWTGNVYSKDSGDTYYGTVDMKGPNTLRVEACALGRFYCSGNNWIRISARPLVTQRQVETRPRS